MSSLEKTKLQQYFFSLGEGGGGFCFMADSDTSFVVYDGNKDFWPDLLIMWCDL